MSIRILVGDCRERMAEMEPVSVDAIVTDPPYLLAFMSKTWDTSGEPRAMQAWHETWAREAYRVLKPGGHMVAFGGTRTHHRLMVAIEDAGFEIRDCLMWLYGSGFPKSLDVSKAIDKAAGAEREITGETIYGDGKGRPNQWSANGSHEGWKREAHLHYEGPRVETAPATDLARRWDGWGTALKPAYEPIVMARKPLIGSVAANVARYGTGGINVDGCRIGTDVVESGNGALGANGIYGAMARNPETAASTIGRWPANVLLDEDAAALLDAQSGERPSRPGKTKPTGDIPAFDGGWKNINSNAMYPGDTGGASRFF
jgi:hypothetical protein